MTHFLELQNADLSAGTRSYNFLFPSLQRRNVSCSLKKAQGMTLVEILVALVILGITILLFSPFVTSLRNNQKATEQTTALTYARNYLEGLRVRWQTLEGYQTLSLATPIDPPASYDLNVQIQNGDGDTVFSFPGSSSSDDLSPLRNVTLTFTDEEDKTVTLVTQIARPTPVPSLEEDDESN